MDQPNCRDARRYRCCRRHRPTLSGRAGTGRRRSRNLADHGDSAFLAPGLPGVGDRVIGRDQRPCSDVCPRSARVPLTRRQPLSPVERSALRSTPLRCAWGIRLDVRSQKPTTARGGIRRGRPRRRWVLEWRVIHRVAVDPEVAVGPAGSRSDHRRLRIDTAGVLLPRDEREPRSGTTDGQLPRLFVRRSGTSPRVPHRSPDPTRSSAEQRLRRAAGATHAGCVRASARVPRGRDRGHVSPGRVARRGTDLTSLGRFRSVEAERARFQLSRGTRARARAALGTSGSLGRHRANPEGAFARARCAS
jgi:hypothetical protein